MSARSIKAAMVVAVAIAVLCLTAAAAFATSGHVSKPALSGTPKMGQAFTVSGTTTPKAKRGTTVVVKIQVLMKMDGDMYEPMDDAVKARLTGRSGGYKYSASITILMKGDHAVQAIRYVNGKVVKKSAITYFTVEDMAQQVSVDSDSHADVTVAAHTPLDVVFHSPTSRMCGAKVYFLNGDLTRTLASRLTYHAEGLMPAPAAWRCPMEDCCYGNLIVQ